MADAEGSTHPDPALPPTKGLDSSKGEVQPIDPSQHRGLAKLPGDVRLTLSKADETLLRLNKMIKTTAGLGAALSTLNYSIYLAAYLHANSPSRAAAIAYISRLLGRPSKGAVPATAAITVSPLLPIGALVSETRTTLRLTGLLPLYIWLKTLLSKNGSKDIDPLTHRIALMQCLAYMTFQGLENAYHLTNKSILPKSVIDNRGGIPKWLMWSCRAWLVGVSSDFLRLWREAALAKEKREKEGRILSAQEQQKIDQKWWAEFQTAAAWMPVAIHYSVEGGLKGMNLGLVGLFGMLAGLNNFKNAWAATAN